MAERHSLDGAERAIDRSEPETDALSRPSRRRFVQLAGATGLGAGLAGCFSSEGEEELRDDITISLGYTPNVAADFWVNLYGIIPYFTAVVEPLVWVDDDMELEPWLATDWESTGDRTWEFTLREDVTFHNDEPLDADAVVFSIQEIFAEFDNARPFLQIDGPEGVGALDDRTVEFTTIDPFPNFPGNIAHNMAAVQHPDAEEPADKPIGTGPFRLVDREKDQRATVETFEDYWRDTEPKVEEITYRVIDDASSRVLSLEAHEVDVAYNLPTAQVESLRQNEDTEVHLQQRPQIVYVGTNVHRSPTDDATLRQALNYATDQELLVETIVENIGVPATGPVPQIIYWSAHDDLPEYGPDVDRGKELVEESDYDGEALEMLVNPRMALGTEIAQALQDWFDRIGVTTEIRQLEYAAHVDRWHGGEAHLRVGDNGVFNGAADILMYGLFHSEGQQNREMYEANGTGVMNLGPELDDLIERARQSRDREETIQYYTEAQQLIMEEAVVVPLYYEEYVVGTYSDVAGLHTPPIMQMVKWEGLEHREA